MKEIYWKWIGTIAFVTAYALVIIYPEQVNIKYLATVYTVALLLFNWQRFILLLCYYSTGQTR